MASLQGIPIQDSFKIKTPSMTVTITAENLAMPPLSGDVPVPGNLVTIDPNPGTSTQRQQRTGEDASPKVENAPVSPSFSAESTEAYSHAGTSTQRARELSDMQYSPGDTQALSSPPFLPRRDSSASIISPPFRRSSSIHADALYGKVGLPPPIQPFDAEVSEELTSEGYAITRDKEAETKDFTYWDKLRRSGTRTEIRRWRTFIPEGEQDSAFYGRPVGVDVPAESYTQGAYYVQEKETAQAKEYKLPTRAYVAPAIWIRRVKPFGLCDSAYMCKTPVTAFNQPDTLNRTHKLTPERNAGMECAVES